MTELKCKYSGEMCPYVPVALSIRCDECMVKKAYKRGFYEQRPHEECRTCKHFVRGGLDGKTYVCEHPYILLDDHFDYACITMNGNDFCSRYMPKEGEAE